MGRVRGFFLEGGALLGVLGVLALHVLVLFAPPGAWAALVDAVLAEVGTEVVTAGDVALARALNAFDLGAAPGPITPAEVDRVVDARLMVREAEALDIGVTPAAVEEAWRAVARAGGAPAAGGWLERVGVSEAWARQVLTADLRRRRFIEVRFGSFAFVSEFDVDEALGPGEHSPATREATRRRLLEAEVARSVAEWLREARGAANVRLVIREPVPVPFGP